LAGVHAGADDRKSKAGAAGFPGAGGVRAVKEFEDAFQFSFGHAGTVVADN